MWSFARARHRRLENIRPLRRRILLSHDLRAEDGPHEIEIWFAVAGEAVYMLSGGRDRSDWVRNLMEEPKVRVRIAGETFEGRARVIEGEEDDPLARDLPVENHGKEPGKLARWRERSLPVRVDFPL